MSQTELNSLDVSTEERECVVEAVSSTLEWIAGERPEYGGETSVDQGLRCEGIVGCISLIGDIEWSLVISIPEPTAEPLAASFAGFEVPFDSPDMGDAIGELANLVAGEVKVHLDGIGISADISLPQIFRGDPVELVKLSHVPARLFSFESACGPFWVAIGSGQ